MRPKPAPPPSVPARGRPRSLSARGAILDATHALVREGGYPAATIEAISARSGVAKTTIYRWWPNRPALVVDLLMQLAQEAVPMPTGKDPLRALHTELRQIGEAADGLLGRLLTSLLGEAQRDPAVRTALLEGLFHPRSRATAKVVGQAQASGTLRRDIPPNVAVDLLVGPVFYRMFVRHEPVSPQFVDQVFEHVLTGLRTSSRSARARGAR